jgi:hypothetical protein
MDLPRLRLCRSGLLGPRRIGGAVTADDALDALAVALAPRLLREVRALIEAEAGDDRALAVAGFERIGYTLGSCPSSSLLPTGPATGSRSATGPGIKAGSGSRSRTKRARDSSR